MYTSLAGVEPAAESSVDHLGFLVMKGCHPQPNLSEATLSCSESNLPFVLSEGLPPVPAKLRGTMWIWRSCSWSGSATSVLCPRVKVLTCYGINASVICDKSPSLLTRH